MYKLMKKKILLLFLLFCSAFVSAQKEANHWFFGNNAGVDFNSGSAVGITGALNTSEGSASISDRNGALLFYTDGVTVWNKNHVAMPNGTGLLGFASSTQSALILRKPGSDNIYYLFTADGTSNALAHHMENGYRYSTVDMNLAGGFGDVTSVKNVLLYAPSTEKLAAVKQADGVNLWLMTHEWNSSQFRAYSLTCSGLDTNAVISDAGVKHEPYGSGATTLYTDAIGQMKFSPDGKRLAQVVQGKFRVQVCDFNNATGIVSNPVNILAYWIDTYIQPDGSVYDFEDIYGVEFSPNSKLLYLSRIANEPLYQYDLSSGTAVGISSTGVYYQMGPWCTPTSFGWTCPATTGALQLGPDGKIYGAYKPFLGLNVIAEPDVYGTGCNFTTSPPLINTSNHGLPGFMASYFDPDAIRIMSRDCNDIIVGTDFANAFSYSWDFGDSLSTADVSTVMTPSYTYSDSGKYIITLVLTNNAGCSDTITREVSTAPCDSTNTSITSLNFPNVFSPNGDGKNDLFEIPGIENYPDNEIIIYNRWGSEIFHKKNYSRSDSFAGKDCSDGVYYYSVEIPSLKLKHYGFVTIFR